MSITRRKFMQFCISAPLIAKVPSLAFAGVEKEIILPQSAIHLFFDVDIDEGDYTISHYIKSDGGHWERRVINFRNSTKGAKRIEVHLENRDTITGVQIEKDLTKDVVFSEDSIITRENDNYRLNASSSSIYGKHIGFTKKGLYIGDGRFRLPTLEKGG
jgi:hypothetical protein